jgi:hypothetical protein
MASGKTKAQFRSDADCSKPEIGVTPEQEDHLLLAKFREQECRERFLFVLIISGGEELRELVLSVLARQNRSSFGQLQLPRQSGAPVALTNWTMMMTLCKTVFAATSSR